MKSEEINIRDPFVLLHEGKYYMYGTRGKYCWTADTGFDCYVSEDLKEWTGPVEVFRKPQGFWADKNCWAPEVHHYKEKFYMFATFKDSKVHGGTAILIGDSPLGPFREHSNGQITPKDWECIDGTFYVSQEGKPYMVFVHEWVQIKDGSICRIELSEDLKEGISEPVVLFHASEARSWISPFLNEKRPGNNYVTDGPYLYRTSQGRLIMLWSSFGAEGYTEALAYSDNGDITGNWIHEDRLLFKKDGGHGMIFKDYEGNLLLTLHTPNEHLKEHPEFYRLEEKENTLWVSNVQN
jgi:beta-xylosidase